MENYEAIEKDCELSSSPCCPPLGGPVINYSQGKFTADIFQATYHWENWVLELPFVLEKMFAPVGGG